MKTFLEKQTKEMLIEMLIERNGDIIDLRKEKENKDFRWQKELARKDKEMNKLKEKMFEMKEQITKMKH